MRRLALLTFVLGAWLALAVQPASAQQLVPFGGQTYAGPYYVTSEPGNPDRVYVAEAAGRIKLVTGATTGNGTTQGTDFLDVSSEVCDSSNGCGGESGMTSMAFAPDYATSGLLYVFFTRDVNPGTHELVIKEFRRTTNPDDIDEVSTGRDVLVIPHPTNQNHNGGQLQFGPDGYLYIATGDGGSANDPPANAQNLNSLLGKLLRIDPRGAAPGDHTNPSDNPFFGATAGTDEIYAYGLRNPYRFSFDRLTGDLTIGDVGQAAWEEIDFVPNGAGRGANFGWDCYEGFVFMGGGGNPGSPEPQCSPPPQNATPPVFQYQNPPATQAAINGGYVVRDTTVPSLLGRYVYADSSGAFPEIRSIQLFPGGSSGDSNAGMTGGTASFGQDACGHVYVAKFDGSVSRIQSSTATPACAPQTASNPPVADPGVPATIQPAPLLTQPSPRKCRRAKKKQGAGSAKRRKCRRKQKP